MFKIISKEELNESVTRITVEAEDVAAKAMAGQFAVLIVDETGERIPLTLADWDKVKGTITMIFQKVGFTTNRLGRMNIGDSIAHILGPLGHPTEIKNVGTVVCIGGGVGIAEVLPVSRAFKEIGNRVIGIIGSRTKDLVILETEMRKICDELFITTDDGSAGRKGLVTDILKGLLESSERSTHTIYPGIVYAIGPVPMMKAVAELTRGCGIKTIASLNPIMVDATGMCASCRCTVAGKTVYGCVDGPDFDAHEVDFDELQKRLRTFKDEEGKADAR
jgi:ferredoxin/flavodoxin---NADP+ reductase